MCTPETKELSFLWSTRNGFRFRKKKKEEEEAEEEIVCVGLESADDDEEDDDDRLLHMSSTDQGWFTLG